MSSSTAKTFTIDTKGTCFMCLKHDLESQPSTNQYSFQRLSKYLQLDLKTIYNISFPMTSVSVLGDSEILVSLCSNCSIAANKFVKLHKDLELIRKRVNICVGQIYEVMQNANTNSRLVHEYRQRIAFQANPLELIQASIADNLRKETIDKCSKLKPISPTSTDAPQSTLSLSRVLPPALIQLPVTAITPSALKRTFISANLQNDSSKVSSTTTILRGGAMPEKEVLVVDLDDSDEDNNANKETESDLVISSVTGASGTTFSTTSIAPLGSEMQPSQFTIQKTVFTSNEQPSVSDNTQPATSFSTLQNFTNEFDLREFRIDVTQSQTQDSFKLISENESWKSFSNGTSQCKLCGKLFDKRNTESLAIHSRMHAGEKPISCQHCNHTFRSIGNRRIHILTYHRKELFSKFRNPVVSDTNFQRTIDAIFEKVKRLNQDSDKPFTCLYCSKYCRHKIDAEAHMINIHFNEIGAKLMEMQRQSFGENDALIEKLEEVKRNRLSCDSCGVKFRQRSSLTRHLTTGCSNINTETNSDPCKTNEQQMMETNEPGTSKSYVIKWKCGVCSVTFATQTDLKLHKALKHGTNLKLPSATESGATYKCQYCGKKFKFYYSQRVHMLTLHRHQIFSKYVPPGTTLEAIENGVQYILAQSMVTTDNMHVCKFCNKDFTGSVESILQNHILVSHFQEVVNRMKSAVKEEEELNQLAQVESTTPADNAIKEEKSESIPECVLPD